MINIQSVSLSFSGKKLFSNLSLHIKKNETHVILGQSGVGKTVLLKIISGLTNPDQGSIIVQTKNVGMLFQKNALFDSLTVYENLEFPLREKRPELSFLDRKKKIREFLEMVELSATEDQFPDSLSGGMQKRLGIARALIIEPELILYDEPTAGLDPITAKRIANMIIKLKKDMGCTVVAVTSDVSRAYQLANTMSLLIKTNNESRLIELGTPEQAKLSKDKSIVQFLNGLTFGPLTESFS